MHAESYEPLHTFAESVAHHFPCCRINEDKLPKMHNCSIHPQGKQLLCLQSIQRYYFTPSLLLILIILLIYNPILSPPSLSIAQFRAIHSIFLVPCSVFFPPPHPSTCLCSHTRGCLSPQVDCRDSELVL